jgi:protein required for attachment to host cells
MKVMKKWIVIINRSEARVFNSENMRKLYTLRNPLGREKNRAFTTGRPCLDRGPGLTKDGIHSMTGEKVPHDEAAKDFARKVNAYLYRRFLEHRFEAIELVAEPRMHGWINDAMDEKLKAKTEWKTKDLGKLSDQELKILFLGKKAVWPRALSSQSNS